MIRKSEDLPENIWLNLSGHETACIGLVDKKGKSPDRFISVRGFFLFRAGGSYE
ncbi:MAG: hypothetical protein SVY10_14460 [Thermodesulfobacteriota bacterium]|nr:hypothetical protein [Thermodesulfobacteriota bacterium]